MTTSPTPNGKHPEEDGTGPPTEPEPNGHQDHDPGLPPIEDGDE